MIIYHGSAPWGFDTHMKSRFDCAEALMPYLPRFQYELVDLSGLVDDQIEG